MENKPKNFNPRSPCGERPTRENPFYNYLYISIHAPRAGSDSADGNHESADE